MKTTRIEPDSEIPSNEPAALIVDALVDGCIVAEHEFDRAVEIATEKIDVRKAMTDYWCTRCVHGQRGGRLRKTLSIWFTAMRQSRL